MQQVIVIHGGTTFKDYDAYLEYLDTKKVSIDHLTYKPMWKELLQRSLGNSYQVLHPSMPNKTNARYNEWKLWFKHISSLFDEDCILVGHSLGAVFLVKYLSENIFPVKIRATILVAAPYDDESIEDLTDFKITTLSQHLVEQAGKLIFINGTDDPVISQSDLMKYKQAVPSAEFISLPAPDHFVREEFPELINILKSV